MALFVSRFPRWLWLLFLSAAVVYAGLSLVLLADYRQWAFDLGIYDQSIWLLGHGGTFNTVAGIHVFGAHMSPVLYLLAPLSWIPGGAAPELVFQAFWVALGVFPAFLLGDSFGRGKLFAVLYLCHPGTISGVLTGTRPWNLAVPVIMLFAWLVASGSRPGTLIAVALFASLFREDIALWIVLVLVVGWRAGRIHLADAVRVAAGPAGVAVMAAFVLLPRFSPTQTYIYERSWDLTSLDFPTFALAATLLRLAYLVIPFGLATAWRNRWMILAASAIPLAGLALQTGAALTTFFQYEMLFIPLFLLIVATGDVSKIDPRSVAVGIIVMALLLGPFRFSSWSIAEPPFRIARAEVTTLYAVTRELGPRLSKGESASLPDRLVPRFSERFQISIFPYPFDSVLPKPYRMDCPLPEVVVEPSNVPWQTPGWDKAKEQYDVVFEIDGYTGYELAPDPAKGECHYPTEAAIPQIHDPRSS